MRVKMLVGRTGPWGPNGDRVRFRRGQVVELPDDVADEFRKAGACVAVGAAPEPKPAPPDLLQRLAEPDDADDDERDEDAGDDPADETEGDAPDDDDEPSGDEPRKPRKSPRKPIRGSDSGRPANGGSHAKYRLFKPRGLAVGTIDGRAHDLGKYGSPESHEECARLYAEWRQRNESPGQFKPSG